MVKKRSFLIFVFILITIPIQLVYLFNKNDGKSQGVVAGIQNKQSANVDISAFIGNGHFGLFGYTSPQALVSLEGEGIFDQTVAGNNGYFQFKEGTLYPALHRLERAGLIQGKWQRLPSGQERRYYYMTPKGQKALVERFAVWQNFSAAVALVMQPTIG